MASHASRVAAPLYLSLCLLLGGSTQDILGNMLLQLLGLGLLAWAAVAPSVDQPQPGERALYAIILAGLLLAALQLVPLPPSVWENLGGRAELAQGFASLGLPAPWLPLSVAPYDSLSALLALIPPLALLLFILRVGAPPGWLAGAVVAGLSAGILLGVLQVGSAGAASSPWYLYPETNVGSATGFFANANHMAILLVIAIPFLAAMLAATRRRAELRHYSGLIVLCAAAAFVIIVGLVLNGSLAGYVLGVPAAVASLSLLLPKATQGRLLVGGAAVLCIVAATIALLFMPLPGNGIRSDARASVASRHEILSTSSAAAKAFFPFGSGVGTFAPVYALFEDHQRLDPTTSVNHAHNDYVELALETGLPGVLVVLAFLGWWAAAAVRAWQAGKRRPYGRAAAIASAAILVHSMVDFPLRTSAIAGCFAVSLAWLLRSRGEGERESAGAGRAARHVVIA